MPNVGSIFQIEAPSGVARYFWCIDADRSQLNSSVIVIFRRAYAASVIPDLQTIVADNVEFSCHVLLQAGTKKGIWRKVGYRPVDRRFPLLYRDTADYGNASVSVSEKWYVWEPNQPQRFVGRLADELAVAEIGIVVPPDCVVARLLTGQYGIVYPAYRPMQQPCA